MNSDTVNDVVLSGIDQFLPQEKIQKDILGRVDEVMESAVRAENPEIAFKAMKSLLGVSQISGLAFAKFIYIMKFQWNKFNRRDSFESSISDELGKTKITIERNYRVWDMLVSGDIPKEYCEKFKLMPIRCLIPIANMWHQKYPVESNQWMKLANAPDPTTINKLIREIKGVEPKEGSLQGEFDTESGSLYVWKDGQKEFVGHLNVESANVAVQAFIDRILKASGILEKE